MSEYQSLLEQNTALSQSYQDMKKQWVEGLAALKAEMLEKETVHRITFSLSITMLVETEVTELQWTVRKLAQENALLKKQNTEMRRQEGVVGQLEKKLLQMTEASRSTTSMSGTLTEVQWKKLPEVSSLDHQRLQHLEQAYAALMSAHTTLVKNDEKLKEDYRVLQNAYAEIQRGAHDQAWRWEQKWVSVSQSSDRVKEENAKLLEISQHQKEEIERLNRLVKLNTERANLHKLEAFDKRKSGVHEEPKELEEWKETVKRLSDALESERKINETVKQLYAQAVAGGTVEGSIKVPVPPELAEEGVHSVALKNHLQLIELYNRALHLIDRLKEELRLSKLRFELSVDAADVSAIKVLEDERDAWKASTRQLEQEIWNSENKLNRMNNSLRQVLDNRLLDFTQFKCLDCVVGPIYQI